MATVFVTKDVQFLFKEKVREKETHMLEACGLILKGMHGLYLESLHAI